MQYDIEWNIYTFCKLLLTLPQSTAYLLKEMENGEIGENQKRFQSP